MEWANVVYVRSLNLQCELGDVYDQILYYGSLFVKFQTDMCSLVEEVNDKHLGPWAEACSLDGVENTPLTPYLDQELLYNKHLYLDGSKLEKTGFSLIVPEVTKEKLMEVNL